MSSEREITAWVFGCTDVGAVRRNNEDAFVIADLTSQTAAGSEPPAGVRTEGVDTANRGSEGTLRKVQVTDQGLLLAVSDGMGGAEAGEVASFLVVESLRRGLESAPTDRPTARLVREVVERANHFVYGEAESNTTRAGMGATLTAVLVRGERAYIAGVGDSRCYVIRERRIRQVTRDQSLVESLVELGHMTREEAEISPHRNVILQALGTRPNIAVALTRLRLRRGDLLLVCSDGLSNKVSENKVSDDEMAEIALAGPGLDDACRALIAEAKARGGEDNITAILAHFSGEGLEAPGDDEHVTKTLEHIHAFNHATGTGYAEPDGDSGAMDTPIDDKAPTVPLPRLPEH
jgi:PPM family protein phosphatase